jgi:hypothetical protein
MRYYSLELTDGTTGAPVLPSSLGGQGITSLLPNGQVNPAALTVEFDIPFANFATPMQNAFVRVWGLGLRDIGSAFNLTPIGKPPVNVTFSAGMSKGLPLANPGQQGVLLRGAILQAWGNWIGTDQTLDFTFQPSSGSTTAPLNFSFSWVAGTPLSAAIAQTLLVAMPSQRQVIAISNNLILPNSEYGIYKSAQQFAAFINGITKPIIGGSYPGVMISSDGTTVTVWDGTVMPAGTVVKAIAFQDMIGQPTWLDPLTISVKLVLRGDLSIGSVISMPQSLATQTQQSYLRFQDKSLFTGNYLVTQIEHFGNSRQPDAASWNTTVQAVLQPKGVG